MNTPSVYLCGPITGESFQDAKYGWRKVVFDTLSLTGITSYSPLRYLDEDHLCEQDLNAMGPNGADVGPLSTSGGLTERDRFDTMRADLVFCNLIGATRPSIGSMIEFGWADSRRIPIVLCMEEGNIHNHAMVTAIASWIVPTLEEGIEVAVHLLVPKI